MEITFPNWWSKFLLKKSFEQQFYIPLPPTIIEKKLLRFIEKRLEIDEIQKISIVKPIFIIGAPRSGTSMLYDLLCSHEQASYVSNIINKYYETPLAIEWLRRKMNLNASGLRFLNDSVTVDLKGAAEPFTYWGKWFNRDIDSLYWEKQTRIQLGEAKVKEIYADIKKILYLSQNKNPRFICKFATVQPEVELLQEIFPDAKFINIIRDGRDVAHSMLKLNFHSNTQLSKINHPLLKKIIPYPRIRELKNYVERFGSDSVECAAYVWRDTLSFIEDIKPGLKNYFELKYEDLIEKPNESLSELFNFCELNWPTNPDFIKRAQGIGKISHKNNYAHNELVSRVCKEALEKYGYT